MADKHSAFRRHLLTLEALAELGPELTGDSPFPEKARTLLSLLMESVAAAEGAIFSYSDRPGMLASLAAHGFNGFPHAAVIPLLPRHAHAMAAARGPQMLAGKSYEAFLTSNGNVSPQMFRCLIPLQVASKLVGAVALGRRQGEGGYAPEDLDSLSVFSHYAALAVHNHILVHTLEQRIAENLRLMASLHAFQDRTLEAFATAIDIKDVHMRGHSLRVGRYASGIGEALGLPHNDLQSLRAGGYLHDIGKVVVDKYIFNKPGALEPREFQEMADHTTVGHQIVHGVELPWEHIPEMVRSHHERNDGSGYPDRLMSDELALPVRITAVADSFDAMTNDRSFRSSMSVGEAASQIVRAAPEKYDAEVVQAFLVSLRRDAVRSSQAAPWAQNSDVAHKPMFLSEGIPCNISPADVDNLASALQHKLNNNRVYLA